MNFITYTKPAYAAVTLAEVWEHLRLTPYGSPEGTDLDNLLTRLIETATLDIESRVRRSFVTRTLRLFTKEMPEVGVGVPLYRPPVVSITSVAYYDGDNVLTEVDSTNYFLTEGHDLPSVQFVSTFSPTLYTRPDALQITYVAGYRGSGSPEASTQAEAVANIPKVFLDAVLYKVESLHANTSPTDRDALEKLIDSILVPHKVHLEV